MAEEAAESPRANRMSRKRQKTHERLISAALSVMAEKGADAATINDITETADVGFGSFYNHFSSKDEILNVATQDLFEWIGAAIDVAVSDITDTLDVLSSAIRMFIGILIAKPEWAKFIIRVSMVPGYKEVGLYPRLFRDIGAVQEAGRLKIPDLASATYAVGGAMLFMVIALLEEDLPTRDAPERISAMALRILGAPEDEIVRLSSNPRPTLPANTLFF